MGIITLLSRSGLLLLFLLGMDSFSIRAATEIPVVGTSQEIEFWDFNTGEQDWITEHSETGWNLKPDGTNGFHSKDKSSFFLVESDAINGNSKELVSRVFSTAGYHSVELSFWHYYRDRWSFWNDDDTGYLEYRVGNDQWKELERYTSTQGGPSRFKKVVVILPEAENVQVRFRYEAKNDWYWAIDNVRIAGTPKVACEPLEVRVQANFCGENNQGQRVLELRSQDPYASYSWELYGQEVGSERILEADIAGTYSLTVTDVNGCTGTGTITTSEELVVNGDFEQGYKNTFNTNYDNAFTTKDLGPEGAFAVDKNAGDYHPNFFGPRDHTSGGGNFLMVNGHPDPGKVIWEQTIQVQPNINYYFSAWGMNLHSANPARLQFTVNGEPAGTVADLDGVPVGTWIRFHSPEFWNSGSETTAVIQIINVNTTANGNDFGIDDISFGNLDPLPFSVDPPAEITICAGQDLHLYANVEGGREPFNFTWTDDRGDVISKEENPVVKSVSPRQGRTYTLTVTDFYGCLPESQVGTTTVTINTQCNSIDFDGRDDHIVMGDHYEPGNSFSLEAWIKPHSLDGTRTILSKNKADHKNAGGFDLSLENDGHVVFRMNGHKIAYRQHKIKTDRWYHLAGVYDGNQAILYIDGIQVASGTMPAPSATPAPFLIGAMHNSSTPWAPENYFHGWIEEVRVWNKALRLEQIHLMMNQRVEEGADGSVKGMEIPMDIPELAWGDLAGYYPLLSNKVQPGGITEDLAREKVKGQLKNMKTFQENTAPLPYYSVRNGDWGIAKPGGASPWAHPEVWNAPNTSGVTNEPITWNIARVSHNITSGKKDLILLGLLSEKAILKVTDATRTQNEYNPGHSLRITHYLDLDGRIDLVGESQLLQDEKSILEEKSLGSIERDQQGTASSYNYNYWASPVSNSESANNAPYRIRDVLMDGTNVLTPGPLVFNHQYHFADGTYSGAKRISTYWLNKYTNSKTGSYSRWIHIGDKGLVKAGEGFSMKGTSGSAAIPDHQNYTFRGKPNNGTIKLEISPGNDYLIGNPYPSAIDAYQFIRDNLATRNTGDYEGTNPDNVFNGTLYFWDHFSGKSHYLQEYVGGYATLNLSGGTEAVASDARINNTGEHADPTKKPQRYIPVGQAFYVSTQLDPRLEEITSVSGGEITFRNSHRVFETDDQQGDLSEFKSRETKEPLNTQGDTREKIYLRFQSPTGYHRQLLVTADPAASDHFDLGYDAPLIDNISEDMYWYTDQIEFVIQGVQKLDREQELPLGIKIKKESEFKVSLDHLENVREGKNIFLRDSLSGTLHDLRTGPYVTTAAPGIINNRFTIVFKDPATTDKEEEKDNEQSVLEGLNAYYASDSRELVLQNPELLNLERLHIHNSLGQQVDIYFNLPQQRIVVLPVKQFSPGVYILKLWSSEGILTKKFILN